MKNLRGFVSPGFLYGSDRVGDPGHNSSPRSHGDTEKSLRNLRDFVSPWFLYGVDRVGDPGHNSSPRRHGDTEKSFEKSP